MLLGSQSEFVITGRKINTWCSFIQLMLLQTAACNLLDNHPRYPFVNRWVMSFCSCAVIALWVWRDHYFFFLCGCANTANMANNSFKLMQIYVSIQLINWQNIVILGYRFLGISATFCASAQSSYGILNQPWVCQTF